MLFFLFSDQELRALFTRLGYDYDPELTRRTIDYYDRRTSHGSTLSLVTHAGVLAGLDPKSSWDRFLRALDSDIEDGQGGHDQRRHPHGCHVRDPGPAAALLRRQRRPRRHTVLRAHAPRPARRARVLDAVPCHPAAGVDSRRRADRARACPRASADRSASASATRSASSERATAGRSRSTPTAGPPTTGGRWPLRGPGRRRRRGTRHRRRDQREARA